MGIWEMTPAHSSKWISGGRISSKPQVRLFCFPYSGAPANIYYPWVNLFPQTVDICPIQLPGHGTRLAEELIHDLKFLIEAAYFELRPLFFDVSFAFFGHSFGALISFELARYLRSRGMNLPSHLFLSGHGAPHLVDQTPHLHQLPEFEFRQRIGELNGMAPEILQNSELMDLLSPIIRADFSCCETYTYNSELPLSIPICALGGLEDKYVTRKELEEWQLHSTHNVRVKLFPGDHFYFHDNTQNLISVILREMLD